MHISLDISSVKFPKGSVEETLMIMIFSGKALSCLHAALWSLEVCIYLSQHGLC